MAQQFSPRKQGMLGKTIYIETTAALFTLDIIFSLDAFAVARLLLWPILGQQTHNGS